ncbi:glutaredoxin [Alphaproteobacteria bacterium]|jgi:glutaredoxin 3|nr:glutaredoxin [Alphaproteobacteria bacterium]
MDVEIYSKTNCIFCDKAKMRLVNENPKIHMLDQDYTREDFFKKFPNARTFPQIIINGESIGGYHELEKWLERNSFKEDF